MPDITMCKIHECPKAKNCYRHEAEPGQWQSYFLDIEYDENGCAEYWPIKDEDEESK